MWCVYVYVSVCMRVCVCVYVCVFTYMFVCMYVCVCVCVYTCEQGKACTLLGKNDKEDFKRLCTAMEVLGILVRQAEEHC